MPSDSWRTYLGPERIAAILATIVVFGAIGITSTRGASGVDTRQPGRASPSVSPTKDPYPFASTARLVLQIHDRLAKDQGVLEGALADTTFDAAGVIAAIRKINATASIGADVADKLADDPDARAVGEALLHFYASVGTAADAALGTSTVDTAGYRAAAKRLLAALKPMADLKARLEALIASTRTRPSAPAGVVLPTPQPTAAKTPSPTPSPTPVPATAAPTKSPRPTIEASPVPSLTGQVENPGFEASNPAPWALVVAAPWTATLAMDATAVPYEGERSARVDIPAAADARTAISLQQGGIEVLRGRRYVCRLALRAASSRDVRIRVVSLDGSTYGTRLVTVDPTWSVVEFEFGAFVDDPAALVEIDLGRSAVTTWVDAVEITASSAP